METLTQRLHYLLNEVPLKIKAYDEAMLSQTKPGKWSKKEILGHLCDSAVNNHHRFVRVQFEKQPFIINSYQQTNWVSVQNYQSTPINEIIELWISLNKHLLRIIENFPIEKKQYICKLNDKISITVEELIKDYLDHMEHHLEQIFSPQIT